jgi:hypothetical protein
MFSVDLRSGISNKIAGVSCLVTALFFSVAAGLSKNLLFIMIFLFLAAACVLTGVYFVREK